MRSSHTIALLAGALASGVGAEASEIAGLDAWVEVPEVALPGWVLSGRSWMRFERRCLPVEVTDAHRKLLAVRFCSEETAAGRLDCSVLAGVEGGWRWRGEHCRLTLPGGRPGPEAKQEAATGEDASLALFEADAGSARWVGAAELEAFLEPRSFSRQPCDAASLGALGRDARRAVGREADAVAAWLAEHNVVDGHRRCETSSGIRVEPLLINSSRLRGEGTVLLPDAVDCRAPCPEIPVRAELAELQERLRGRRFAPVASDELGIELFATEAACREAAEAAAEGRWHWDPCATLGVELVEAAR